MAIKDHQSDRNWDKVGSMNVIYKGDSEKTVETVNLEFPPSTAFNHQYVDKRS